MLLDRTLQTRNFPLPLPDGTYYPDYLANKDPRPHEFLVQFNRVRNKEWSDCSFLDLGCSEGSTTFRLSQMGSTVYGVEGRADGIERAKVLRDILGFEQTHFSVGNVDHESTYREVDGIFNAGVLYHLEDPVTCLERCARSARTFMLIDTGVAPRSPQERANSKFSGAFGEPYTIDYKGLQLDVVDASEPQETEEKKDGIRRKPRSGIGNTRSVWMAHASQVALMKALGFPYHEVVSDQPVIPRLRTAYFRSPPAPVQDIGTYPRPVPKAVRPAQAIRNTRLRDIEYLRRQQRPVTLFGQAPLLAKSHADLRRQGIEVSEVLAIPGDGPITLGHLRHELKGKSGFLVLAVPNPHSVIHRIMLLDQFEYIFTSFGIAAQLDSNVA